MQPQLVKKRQHYQVLPRRKGGTERGSEGRQVEDKDSFSLIEENDISGHQVEDRNIPLGS